MGWWNHAFVEPSAPELSAEHIVKQTQTVVCAYSRLVAESGTNLPESALPYPKDVIRTSLLLWAALEDAPETRTRLGALYVMLEDFLPHDEWKILHEWHRILNTKDMDSLRKADPRFRETAVRLIDETAELRVRRMREFKERLGEAETRPIGLIMDGASSLVRNDHASQGVQKCAASLPSLLPQRP